MTSGTPWHIVFLAAGAPFEGDSPERQALGGSETACVQVARALAARGHRVRVYCRCQRPGLYHGVDYRPMGDLVAHAGVERWDVQIISRDFSLLDVPVQAGLRVLWNHDLLEQPGKLAIRLGRLDLCLVLSDYHAGRFTARLPQCAPYLAVTRNGLDLDLLRKAAQGVRQIPGRVAYVSRPERGLKILLKDIWPALREKRPDLELQVCGYQVDRDLLEPRLRSEYNKIDALLAAAPGVKSLGALAKQDYYRLLASCQAMLYPCTFPEISCLAALEAQALCLPVITSDAYALSETVLTPAFRVKGRPGSPEYCRAYIDQALHLLAPGSGAGELARQAQAKVREHYDWQAVAAQWEELFDRHLAQRSQGQADALAAGLVLGGDRLAAERFLGRALNPPAEGEAPPDPHEEELLDRLAAKARRLLAHGTIPPRVGVLALDRGRTARELAARLPGISLEEVDQLAGPTGELGLVVIRDRLERERDPARLVSLADSWASPGGWLLVCAASGAWPLVSAGHAARWHDLGRRELGELLPGRGLEIDFVPGGLVGAGAERFFAGRLLAVVPAGGPPPGHLDPQAPLRRVRPVPPALLEEVRRAGLV